VKLRDLPQLKSAVQALAAANNMPCCDQALDAIDIPDEWRVRCCLADDQVGDLSGLSLDTYIPHEEINTDNADPQDDCLETMVDGEESVKNLLVMHTNSGELDQVLNAFFDGELSKLLQE
jgi:hypothetical protein